MLSELKVMESVVRELEREAPYTIDRLMCRYRSIRNQNTFCAYTERLAAEMEPEGYHRTARAYRTAAERLRQFNGGHDPNPEQLTAVLIGDFQQSLKSEGCEPNTVSFYMRTLRAIYNKAVAEGYIYPVADNPFSGVYTGVFATRKRALNPSDLTVLSAFDPTMAFEMEDQQQLPDHLGCALAMFLFCYHARGMCFVDMANLKKSDIRGDTIRYRRAKTGQLIELRVLPAMRRIIEWFEPQMEESNYLFPVITDPEKDFRLQYESGLRLQNMRLKKVAAICGIADKLSTHAARHSWATVAKNHGLPTAVISEGLGHSNQHTTEIYLASLERSVIDHASRMISEAIDPRRPQKVKKRELTCMGGFVSYKISENMRGARGASGFIYSSRA
jgi:integrase